MKCTYDNCGIWSNDSHKGLSSVLFGKKNPTEILAGIEVCMFGIKNAEVFPPPLPYNLVLLKSRFEDKHATLPPRWQKTGMLWHLPGDRARY